MRRHLLLAAASVATAFFAGQAGAVTYVYTSIPQAGYPVTAVSGINDSGQVLVGFGNPTSVGGFVYQGGTRTPVVVPLQPVGGNTVLASMAAINKSGVVVGNDLQNTNGSGVDYVAAGYVDNAGVFSFVNAPGAVETQLTGINNSGVLLGNYMTSTSNGVPTWFTDTGGVFQNVTSGGYSNITAVGIDSAGDVVGSATKNGQRVGFIDSGGVFTSLSIPGSFATTIQAVSESGLIAGNYFANGKDIGFIDDGGVITSVLPTNATIVEITGINDSGTVVGQANHVSFVDQGGTITDLTLPGPNDDPNGNAGVYSINDQGLIGGSYYSGNGFNYEYTAFIASPVQAPGVPEPTTWALLIGGFALTGAALRRRRAAPAA